LDVIRRWIYALYKGCLFPHCRKRTPVFIIPHFSFRGYFPRESGESGVLNLCTEYFIPCSFGIIYIVDSPEIQWPLFSIWGKVLKLSGYAMGVNTRRGLFLIKVGLVKYYYTIFWGCIL